MDSAGDVVEVACTTLDNFLADKILDLLKIDVEGYEAHVLRGAKNLLARSTCFPRTILMEIHPYCWESYGTDSSALGFLLRESGYHAKTVEGKEVNEINLYEHITAVKE